MFGIGIIGAGQAATLHAGAIEAMAAVQLVGLAGRTPRSAGAARLAGQFDCAVLEIGELARRCDALIVATPPAMTLPVLSEVSQAGEPGAVLLESPVATTIEQIDQLRATTPAALLTASNLLHSATVRHSIDAIRAMNPHHLELRVEVPTPAWGDHGSIGFGGGVSIDPGAAFWPLLLAAFGTRIATVTTTRHQLVDGLDTRATIVLTGCDGRRARAVLAWGSEPARSSLEAADAAHAARVDIWPTPNAEFDGRSVGSTDPARHPLDALGYIAQIDRLRRVALGQVEAWPDLAAGSSVLAIAVAAANSIIRNGEPIAPAGVARDTTPCEVLTGRA